LKAGGWKTVAAAGLLLTAGGGAAWAHDVKDPVCRMGTDTDTTPFRETINGKTYFFCSDACKARFDKSPASYVTLNAALAHGIGRSYALSVAAPPQPQAGRPIPLTFTVHEAPLGKLVRDFELVHAERLHLMIVSADFAYFEHQHPALGADGHLRLAWTFPRAGRYYLFADFTPADGDNQVLRRVLDVGGPLAVKSTPPRLRPDAGAVKTADGTRVALTLRPGPLRAGQQAVLTYTLTDFGGHPRTDMQPILGVMGHLIALRDDGRTMVHAHALHGVESGSYGAAMLAMLQAGQAEAVPITPDMVTETGPCFTFKLTLPSPGRYKLWAQFQRQNTWLTVPFTLDVGA